MSNHDDDKLNTLENINIPAPSEAARRRAIDAALLAFDTEQAKAPAAAKGIPLTRRLRSMLSNRGNWIMDNRLTYGLGTAAIALLLLPLGYQLYTSTTFTPPGRIPAQQDTGQSVVAPEPTPMKTGRVTAAPPKLDSATAKKAEAPISLADTSTVSRDEAASAADAETAAAPATPPTVLMQEMAAPLAAPVPSQAAGAAARQNFGVIAPPPADALVAQPTEPSGDRFTRFTESPVKIVKNEPVSTFSIDVDTASYAYVRRSLNEGYVPQPDAVRIEELINYFDYAYLAPTDAARPFQPTVTVFPTPWNPRTELVQIGIRGYVPPAASDKPSNLVFLIDTSGSMDEADKLPLLKRAFTLLVDRLGPEDTISIVTYAGSAGVVLEPTRASDKAKILVALDNLTAGGSTAGAEGIELAYRLAEQNKVTGGVNRVILATDGDFNVGIEDPEELKTFIKEKRDSGVFLSVLGFGEGNLGDDTMQALAQNGNGNASYIDSFKEAQKVLVEDAGGTLDTIAKDVKIQVEFNPAVVSEYRLVGYETRALNREDFNNDKVDAGDIGAGTTVTALYEITPVGSGAELNDPLRYGNESAPAGTASEIGFLKLRYKLPNGTESKLIEQPIDKDVEVPTLAQAPADARFAAAVAAFGQKLKGSNYGAMSWNDIRSLAQGARGPDENGYRAEFVQLIDAAKALKPDAGE